MRHNQFYRARLGCWLTLQPLNTMELFCALAKESFLKVAPPTSVCFKMTLVGWGWVRTADSRLDTSNWRIFNNEDVQNTSQLTQLSSAPRPSQTFFSSSCCLRWERSLLCSICNLMSFISCFLSWEKGLMSYFCNALPEGIKIEWNKQLLHKYKSGTSINYTGCVYC